MPGPPLDLVAAGVLVGSDVGTLNVDVRVAAGVSEASGAGVSLVGFPMVGLGVVVANEGGDVNVTLGSSVGLKIAVMVKSGVGKTKGVGAERPGRLQARVARSRTVRPKKGLVMRRFITPPTGIDTIKTLRSSNYRRILETGSSQCNQSPQTFLYERRLRKQVPEASFLRLLIYHP